MDCVEYISKYLLPQISNLLDGELKIKHEAGGYVQSYVCYEHKSFWDVFLRKYRYK